MDSVIAVDVVVAVAVVDIDHRNNGLENKCFIVLAVPSFVSFLDDDGTSSRSVIDWGRLLDDGSFLMVSSSSSFFSTSTTSCWDDDDDDDGGGGGLLVMVQKLVVGALIVVE